MPSLRILVTGATGFLGPFAVRALRARGHSVVTCSRSGGDAVLDLTARGSVDAVVEALAPDAVLHLAAMSRMADCAADPGAAERINAAVPARLAERFGDRMVYASTDLVFDGASSPYGEGDPVSPRSPYGLSKAAGEREVIGRGGRVVRLPLLFGPDEHGRGATGMIRCALGEGRELPLFTNEYRTPLHAADAADGLAEIVPLRGGPKCLHMPGPERCSRWDLGLRFCRLHGLDVGRLHPIECQDAERPRDVSLRGEWRPRRGLDEMLRDA